MAVVSLLVTDIVESTRLWLEDERAMAEDLRVHDELVGRVVGDHGGSIFKHTGDGAMARFDDPLDALAGAVDLQRSLAAVTWGNPAGVEVRAAVHCGTVVQHDGDLFGTPVNRVARMLAMCPPGGVLVSPAAAGLLADRSLGDVTLVEVGQVVLRGFGQLEPIFAATGDGLAPAVPLDGDGEGDGAMAMQPSLLPQVDQLVGRHDELTLSWECVRSHHVVSIVGVGGMGKTRLAIEIAAGAEHEFGDGVWWCDLASATTADAVLPVVLDALRTRQEAGRTAMEAIEARLRDATALVVLDNCEHVVVAARALVQAIRSAAPRVRFLVTSREALGVPGERIVPLSSMHPDDATELFRITATAAGVTIDEAGSDAVVERICDRLDGIPLAIELAAARCRSLSPSEIDDRLSDRFRLLRGGRSGAERHRTLQAAVAWSYDLLSAEEQDLFDRLAVFADGSHLDGIAAVSGLDDYDALDIVDRLVARSMLATAWTELGTRYRLLETLRQFAEDRLVERELITEMRDRHLAWVCQLAGCIRDADGTSAAGPMFRRYVAEIDNMRLAVAHAVSAAQHESAVKVVAGANYAILSRPTLEVLTWFDPAALPVDWSAERAMSVGVNAMLRYLNGDHSALGNAVALVPADFHDVATMLMCRWTDLLWTRADLPGATAVLDTASREHLDGSYFLETSRVFTDLAAMLFGEVDADFAARAQRDAAALVEHLREVGDELNLSISLSAHANSLTNGGRADLALAPGAEAVVIANQLGAGFQADIAHGALARALAGAAGADAEQRPEIARQLRRFLLDALDRGNLQFGLVIIDGVAVLIWEDDPRTAYLLATVYRREWSVNPMLPAEARALLDPTELAELDDRAATMPDRDALALALGALDRYLQTEQG